MGANHYRFCGKATKKIPKRHDVIWVIVDRLIKSVHFLLIKWGDPLDKLASLYLDDVIRLHGALISIISYRDPRFTLQF